MPKVKPAQQSMSLNSAELYDPATGIWSMSGNLNTARVHHTATLLPGGKVLVVGASAIMRAVLISALTQRSSMTRPLRHGASSPTSSRPVAITQRPCCRVAMCWSWLVTAELYDPATDTWSSTTNLNTTRTGHTATLLPNGKVLVASGNTAELFDAYATSCADSISPTDQSLESSGATASVDVTAGSECSWTAATYSSWISLISVSSSGNGKVSSWWPPTPAQVLEQEQ